MPVFIDADILLVSVDAFGADREKRDIARRIMERRRCRLSVKVLEDFFVLATGTNGTRGLTGEQAARFVHNWRRFPVQETTIELFEHALMLQRVYDLPLRDAEIVASAKKMSCSEIYSQSLQKGRVFDGIEVVDPFAEEERKVLKIAS